MSQQQREQIKVAKERAVLVAVRLPRDPVDLEDRLKELHSLADTAGAEVVGMLTQRLYKPVGRTFLGKGKVEELGQLIEMVKAGIVIFDHDLTPAQIRNLEQMLSVKVLDRSELILDIFARRATTHAARLQVEIAQLEYTYPRLRAMWDHLGQVTGGAPIGIGTRGPGEQQLEIDRRLVQRRLKRLQNELDGIHARKAREVTHRNEDHYTVGLVGYTNAGKSSLFNRVTTGGAFAHDKLFATLSTRVEQWSLGDGNSVLLSDTVGFIRNLPHHLVASFRSTLEETVQCSLLLVMVDVSDPTSINSLTLCCRHLTRSARPINRGNWCLTRLTSSSEATTYSCGLPNIPMRFQSVLKQAKASTGLRRSCGTFPLVRPVVCKSRLRRPTLVQ